MPTLTHFRLTCSSCGLGIADFRMTVPAPGVPNQMRKRHREKSPDCPAVDDPPLCLQLTTADGADTPPQLKGLPADLAAGIEENVKQG